MKSVYNISRCLVIMLLCGASITAFATEKQDFTKTIKKEFDITADGMTNISNRYGKVYVKTWERNRTKIDVKITVRAESEEAAQRVFNRIKIEFSNTPDMVKAQTLIDAEKSNWNLSWSFNSKTDYSIDYDVTIPANGALDLSNKYGDAFLTTVGGRSNVDIKYGNLQADEFRSNLSLQLAYGKGTVIKAKDVIASGSYCQLRINHAQDLDITSKYSKVNIDKAANLRSVSQYDSYKINEVHDLKNQGKYDNLEIGMVENLGVISKYAEVTVLKVANSADLDLQYGGASIDKLAKGFSEVRLVGSYADYKIKVEDGANYQVEAVADYAGIHYPSAMQVTYEKDKGTYHEVNGFLGQKGARSVIKARLDYGGLKVW